MFLSEISHKKIKGWNKRVLGEVAAYAYCKTNKIYLVDDNRQKFGKLAYYKGHAFILINPNLEAGMRLWVLWHEIAHYILHYPETSKFSASMKRKNDREANYVAAVALMPKHIVEGKTGAELEEEFGYPAELIKIRKTIYDNEER